MIDKKKALAFVKDYLKKTEDSKEYKQSERAYWHPDARASYGHTKRVHKYARMLCNFVEEVDHEAVEIAAIFHDIGKFSSVEDHAKVSAEITRGYLEREGLKPEFIDKVCKAINNHSKKTTDEEVISKMSIEDKVLIDADMVEGTGLMGFIWIAMSEGNDDLCYDRFLSKVNTGIGYLNEYRKIAHTQKAREIIIKNMMMIKGLAHTLELEMKGDIL